MRKIFLLFTLMILAISQLQAQTDTVSFPDPWYLYRPLPAAPYADGGSFYPYIAGYYYLQAFPIDTVVEIYGVACVIDTIHTFKDIPDSTYFPMLFRHEGAGPWPNSQKFSIVDSVSFSDNIRQCKFKYVYADCYATHLPGDTTLNCFEFFFDRPIRSNTINSVSGHQDSIFVGRRVAYSTTYTVWERRMILSENVGFAGGGAEYGSGGDIVTNYNGPFVWGPFFPIVRLRCVKPSLELVGNHGDTAELAVHVVEPSWTSYELSVGDPGSDPDSGSVSSLPAYTSQHTLTGLSPNRHYSAWVRKACHYGTNSYDTIVWSDWSDPVDFFGPIDTTTPADTTIVDPPTDTTAIDTTLAIPNSHLSPLTSHLTIRPNPASDEVTLLSSFGITAVEAYNASGTLVFSSRDNSSFKRLSDHALSLDLSSWPRGSYLLRIHTPAGTTTKKLIVQ